MTFIVFDTTVNETVSVEVRLLGKTFAALLTFIISHTGVCAGVCLKLALVFKSFTTLLTLKLALFLPFYRAVILKTILVLTTAIPHT